MGKRFKDIIKQALLENALATSPQDVLRELDNANIPFHEKELKKAISDIEKAKASGDGEAFNIALNQKIKELESLVALYSKKKTLLVQLLAQSRDEVIENENQKQVAAY